MVPGTGCPAARRGRRARLAAEVFGRLRAANGGTLSGFFDVFAWREPGQVAFVEAKVGPDRIKATQLRFMEIALHFHRLDDFMIVEIPGSFPHRTPPRQAAAAAGRTAAAAAGRRRDSLRRPGPAACAPPACPGRPWS